MRKRRIYLDYGATTPVDKRVLKKMLPYFNSIFGNPSSIHFFGQEAQGAITESRQKVAKALNCLSEEIIFVSGGTEAENLALKGLAFARKKCGNHIITTKIEHASVASACEYLAEHNFSITYLPVNKEGRVNSQDLRKEINKDTILATVMLANNEVGTIQPIREIGLIIEEENKKRIKEDKIPIHFHVDAEAAFAYLDCDVKELKVHSLTINGSKIYGPKGTAALYFKKDTPLVTQICGGGQENFRRGGTENVPAIMGLGEAVRLVLENRKKEFRRIGNLRNKLIEGVLKKVEKVRLNTPIEDSLPNLIHFTFFGIDNEKVVKKLSKVGIAVSTGAACAAKLNKASSTLLAIGIPESEIHSGIRFTLGRETKLSDVEYLLKVLPLIINKNRKII